MHEIQLVFLQLHPFLDEVLRLFVRLHLDRLLEHLVVIQYPDAPQHCFDLRELAVPKAHRLVLLILCPLPVLQLPEFLFPLIKFKRKGNAQDLLDHNIRNQLIHIFHKQFLQRILLLLLRRVHASNPAAHSRIPASQSTPHSQPIEMHIINSFHP